MPQCQQIAVDSGQDGRLIFEHVRETQQAQRNERYGYDVLTDRYVDMIAAGILDSIKAVRSALQNAASIAAMILTTDTLITEIPEQATALPSFSSRSSRAKKAVPRTRPRVQLFYVMSEESDPMYIPSKLEIKHLMEEYHSPCISLFLPIERFGPETQQNPVRLRNHLREIERQVEQDPRFATKQAELLEPLQRLLDDKEFWREEGQGLALFRNLEVFRCYHLPEPVPEQMVVGTHFSLKPLFPFLTDEGHFYILAFSQNAIRLLRGTRYTVQEVLLPKQVPESLAAALQYDETEKELQYHSSASGAMVEKGGRHTLIFHGKGESDEAKEHLVRYFQKINRGLRELLHDEKVPLVLASVEYLIARYRQVNTYPHLLESGLAGNPDKLSAQTLHDQAWPLVEPVLLRVRQEAIAQYQEVAETEQASNNSSLIVPAAFEGRIATLFVARDREQWGRFDPTTEAIEIHEVAEPGDDDLLERAATQTILHGGSVYALEHAQVPGGQLAAAVFRY